MILAVAVPMPLSLTREQKRAAACVADRAYIEAAPGSGKTTVAAERYGVLRYLGSRDARSVLALSFARSARGELAARIRARWGGTALSWPHNVSTLDGLHHRLLSHLLRIGAIHWPGAHHELTVLDTWRGQTGARPLTPNLHYRRVAGLTGRSVITRGVRIGQATFGYGNKAPHDAMLEAGYCTHEEIRHVLNEALQNPELRQVIANHLVATTKAVIVDEVFDGNQLDLEIVRVAAQAGIPTTVIGDPWQALYEFRGAQPELVPGFIVDLEFEKFPVTQSFRFVTQEMRRLAHQLRNGHSVTLAPGAAAEADVVLASRWRHLWDVSDSVLPLAFGQVQNQTDAALALLLEPITASHFGPLTRAALEAHVILDLTTEQVRREVPDALEPVLERIAGGSPEHAAAGLTLLREILRNMGGRSIPALGTDKEAERVASLVALSRRLGRGDLLPGMTAHQAKGREWPKVAVYLQPGQLARLAAGLNQEQPGDRELYVALTRARERVRLV